MLIEDCYEKVENLEKENAKKTQQIENLQKSIEELTREIKTLRMMAWYRR